MCLLTHRGKKGGILAQLFAGKPFSAVSYRTGPPDQGKSWQPDNLASFVSDRVDRKALTITFWCHLEAVFCRGDGRFRSGEI